LQSVFVLLRRVIVIGEASKLPEGCLRYEELLADEHPDYRWPQLDERSAAVMCYTTGTTGDPKGVAYSHRSIYLHALSVCAPWSMGLSENDKCLVIVPCFTPTRGAFPTQAGSRQRPAHAGAILASRANVSDDQRMPAYLGRRRSHILSAVFIIPKLTLSISRSSACCFAEEQRFLAAWLKAFSQA